jgi:hypothetical protein
MSYNGRDFWSASVALTPAAQKYHSPAEVVSPYEGSPLNITIFVSCYNEEPTITHTLDIIIEAMQVIDIRYEVIVIDDASKDGSAERLKRYVQEHPDVPLVFRGNKHNKGLAQNYLDAAFIGRGQYFCMIHGDNAESVETMVDIFRTVGEADILIPYDLTSLARFSFYEVVADTANGLLNFVTGHRINDYSGLQVHSRYNVMRWHPGTNRSGFQAVMLCQLLDLGFTCKQVPCRSTMMRHHGLASALRNLFSATRAILDILLWRVSQKIGW